MRKVTGFLALVLTMAVMASCDFAVDMTYEFSKGASLSDVNPTINIYNASDGFTVEETTVMSSSILSVNVTCFENDTICWGAYSGDTEWGCGKNCSATDSSYCVSCKKDETIPVSLEPQTGTMTWTIVKDLNNANPTINFYDVDSDKTAIKSNVKLDQATTTTSVTCKIGNMICIGADFELAGEDFVIGCGEGCVDYEDYETDLINSNECQPCVDGNADQVNYTNFI